ncbi:MAG: metallophosphoesterase [Gammaproteobacteria bacterium]|nr:metallophosphoesterase [Gammaproteobacteria bacterium]
MNIESTDVIVSYSGTRKLVRAGLTESIQHGAKPAADTTEALQLGMMQAGLQQALIELEREERYSDVMIAPEHGPASLLLSFLSEYAADHADELEKDGKLVTAPEGGYEVMYDEKDYLGWAGSFFTWGSRLLGKHQWVDPPTTPEVLPNDVRVAILGDWGSGRYGAPVCAESIDGANPTYDLAIHLGDVYYSGTKKEVERNFLRFWPKKPKISRACNSNHEMYTGGKAYFDDTLSLFGQPSGASNFLLASGNWLLIGLDTAYDDHDISKKQLAWLRTVLEEAEGRTAILFSHHQPFSGFERGGKDLREKLDGILSSGKVFAWYWGHEHRCALYDRHPGWKFHGRCAGHSGFPYFREKLDGTALVKANPDGTQWRKLSASEFPAAMFLDGPNPYVKGHENEYGPHGYLSLELSGMKLYERVHAADGTLLHEAPLE